jgi:hypothetical protein
MHSVMFQCYVLFVGAEVLYRFLFSQLISVFLAMLDQKVLIHICISKLTVS